MAMMALEKGERAPSMDEKIRQAIFRQVEREPFAQKFGLRLLALEEGYSLVEMIVTQDMENFLGTAHGGALFALIDEAFETASNSHGTVAVALSMMVNYIAPPATGSKLTAEAKEFSRTRKTANYDIRVKEFSRTRKTANYDIRVHDEQGQLIAACQALVYRKGIALPFLEEVSS
jgi:acyl-CoA thioesterase